MKSNYKQFIFLVSVLTVSLLSCKKHLAELNVNPNGANPNNTNPSLLLPTVLTETGKALVGLGFGDIAGVMQYTQKDGWTGSHNNYEWGGSNDWAGYYDILRNNQFVYDKAVAADDKLLRGISLVMKSLVFGLITDMYGDAPYTNALQGNKGGMQNTFPVYESQQNIYEGILKDLDTANTLLSKPKAEYITIIKSNVDVYYGAEPSKWRKLANSLALRYYMRISDKLPDIAKAGIEKIVNNPANYPLILTAAEDATMAFAGNSAADSWPTATLYDPTDASNYRRIKMCNTFVKALQALQDPRLGVWAAKVQVILKVDEAQPPGTDKIVDALVNGESRKVRLLSPDVLAAKGLTTNDINQDADYVGLPVALAGPQAYNLSPDLNQASKNPHVSWLNDIYKEAKGSLLKARIMSAAEVNLIIAEAKAVKGWTNADAQQSYKNGIKASFDAWGLTNVYNAYIANATVAFNGTQKQIIEQKWIANWSNATEAWFDFRRTGYPQIHGVQGRTLAPELPVRLYYPRDEQNLNAENVKAAAAKLQTTPFSGFGANGANNSPWSKMWVIQGTGKPW